MDDGAVVRVRRHGNLAGPRLLLSHGNGFAIEAYYPFWSLLARRWEVVLFDQRNHGVNPLHGGAGHTYPQFSADLDRIAGAVADLFGAKPTVGVFHSLSAIAATLHALTYRWRWDALILFDPPLVPLPGHPLHGYAWAHEERLIGWSARRRDRFKEPDELGQQFARTNGMRLWCAGSHQLMAQSTLRRDADGSWVLACPRELESSIYGANGRLGLWPRPTDFAGPVTLISGDPELPDAMPPARVGRALHDELDWPYVAIPQTSHMLQIEQPDACVAAVETFLAANGIVP
jgi:pimeloyl-ACP methyl ester carboxylesterase